MSSTEWEEWEIVTDPKEIVQDTWEFCTENLSWTAANTKAWIGEPAGEWHSINKCWRKPITPKLTTPVVHIPFGLKVVSTPQNTAEPVIIPKQELTPAKETKEAKGAKKTNIIQLDSSQQEILDSLEKIMDMVRNNKCIAVACTIILDDKTKHIAQFSHATSPLAGFQLVGVLEWIKLQLVAALDEDEDDDGPLPDIELNTEEDPSNSEEDPAP